MARSLSRPETTYAPGTYGPFGIDSFTNVNTDFLELALTIVGWPAAVDPLFIVRMSFGDGTQVTIPVSGNQGAATSGTIRLGVPKVAGLKQPVSGGSVEIEVFAPLTTAFTFRAV